eukprot:m.21864 g.21864  ORF g.21864 m.21864 type:complete len:166 (-) comp5396_c0_seq1:421-918(-)
MFVSQQLPFLSFRHPILLPILLPILFVPFLVLLIFVHFVLFLLYIFYPFFLIPPPLPGISRYTDRVKCGIKEALSGERGPHTEKLIKYIETWTGITLTDGQLYKLQSGIVTMANRICDLDLMKVWQDTSAVLSNETSLKNATENDVNISFLSTVQTAFQDAIGKN